jgi:hypothetical protein
MRGGEQERHELPRRSPVLSLPSLSFSFVSALPAGERVKERGKRKIF